MEYPSPLASLATRLHSLTHNNSPIKLLAFHMIHTVIIDASVVGNTLLLHRGIIYIVYTKVIL
jgi:hypothetical protein